MSTCWVEMGEGLVGWVMWDGEVALVRALRCGLGWGLGLDHAARSRGHEAKMLVDRRMR